MKIAISHTDALCCYRSGECDRTAAKPHVPLPDDFIPQLRWNEALYLQNRFGVEVPTHCDVSARSSRRPSRTLNCHVLSKYVPASSFIHLGKQTYLAAPELCLFEMRKYMSEVQLAFLISEFCGDFSISSKLGLDYRERPQLTCTESLEKFIAGAGAVRHHRKLQRALGYAIDNAHSPMELVLALLLSLPAELGGYGLPKPKLNEAVCGYEGDPPESFVSTGYPEEGVFYGDLVYRKHGVVIEYISKRHHQDRWDADALRVNELLNAGFKTLFISPEQVFNIPSTHLVAEKISRQLGVCCPERTDEWTSANIALRNDLFEISNLGIR